MSAAVAAAAASSCYSSATASSRSQNQNQHHQHSGLSSLPVFSPSRPLVLPSFSRYETQKRQDWNIFLQYLTHHRPPLALSRCSSAHVLEFLKYLDQFGKTKVHAQNCPSFGLRNAQATCPCPLRQAWGILDGLIGRLRVAFEENGGRPETNPFAAGAVTLYLRKIKDEQSKR